MNNIHIVIMAGGSGTRFWPYSRASKPKQFLDVLGVGRSLLQITYQRFLRITAPQNIWIVGNEIHRDLIYEQVPVVPTSQILLEPIGRNTAPCIGYAAYKIRKKDENALVVITPADHLILEEEAFVNAVKDALKHAQKNEDLITLGINPTRPETGYGYIQFHDSENVIKKVKTFTEKPQLELAQKFVESGDFVWNAGVFIWSLNAFFKAYEKFLPELAEIFEEGVPFYDTENEENYIKKAYSQCKNISIDYGVMEKADNVYVVTGDFGWSDLGSWNALYEMQSKDVNDNVVDAKALFYNTHNCIVKVPKEKLVVLQDLDGYLVVEHDNVLVICKKDQSQIFREFIRDIKEHKLSKYL